MTLRRLVRPSGIACVLVATVSGLGFVLACGSGNSIVSTVCEKIDNDAAACQDAAMKHDSTTPGDAKAADATPDRVITKDVTSDTSNSCPLDGGTGTLCGDAGCVDTSADPSSCGGCGASFACKAGDTCVTGKCQNVAASLEGLRWNLPCTSAPSGAACQDIIDGGDLVVVTTTLMGTTGSKYNVTLHFRGEVEQRTYLSYDAGGAVGAEDGGGVNPQFFIASGALQDSGDSFNIYELQISDPSQTYYLNMGSSGINNTWLMDYLATIPMNAGATVTLTANAVDDQEIYNNNGTDGGPVYVPGVPPYPAAYNGQFIQMDVTLVVSTP
jgi:hypothetical protein